MKGAAAVLVLALAPAAHAAPPTASVQASAIEGTAPLSVTLTATGDAASWHWNLGDGTTAEGPSVTHAYRTGRFVATLTATSATGETARVRTTISAYALTLTAPRRGTFGDRVRFRGRLLPRTRGAVVLYHKKTRISTARLRADGSFAVVTRLWTTGPYHARFRSIVSRRRSLVVRPVIRASLVGVPLVGEAFSLRATVRPAGPLRVRVVRGGRETLERAFRGSARVRLGSASPGGLRIYLRAGSGATRALHATVVATPKLALGSRGASVRALERRLRNLRYTLKAVDGLYAYDTYEAVLAFQKANGLARTGRVDASLWRRLLRARTPTPRYFGGSHIEVDKRRQLLFEVERGAVTRVLHASTGATGNTPPGRWRVYRKVRGWDWVLWYPMYFKGGFAIHGYPSVPPWPASHGCVRIPMWIAPALYAKYDYGTAVIVY